MATWPFPCKPSGREFALCLAHAGAFDHLTTVPWYGKLGTAFPTPFQGTSVHVSLTYVYPWYYLLCSLGIIIHKYPRNIQ